MNWLLIFTGLFFTIMGTSSMVIFFTHPYDTILAPQLSVVFLVFAIGCFVGGLARNEVQNEGS
jgi:hypothetical protein